MASHLSTYGELEAMPKEDLRREVVSQRALVRKMRMGILLNKEKDTAKYRRERRQLARMLTVSPGPGPNALPEEAKKKTETVKKPSAERSKGLKKKPKTSTVTAPSVS